jgi:hypothetical protein
MCRVSTPFPEPTTPAAARAEVFLRYLDFFRHLGHLDIVTELAAGRSGE